MAINKVVYDGTTLIDLTEDTVTPDTLVKGMTAHDAAGNSITGTYDGVTKTELTNELNNLQQTIPTKTSDIANDSGFVNETFVNQKVADLVNSAPETLDTLGEVAEALQENENVVDALNKAIGNKADKTELFDKDYNSLNNKPIIPTKTSELNNDSGFINTESDPTVPAWAKETNKPTYSYDEITNKPTLFSGNYNDLTNKPTIPTVNGLASESYVDGKVGELKPTITVDTTSGAKSLTLTTGNSNTEWRYTSASGITSLTLNDSGTFEATTEAYYTILFISGSTATTITNTMEAHFTGDDCTDGVFTPVANKTYEVGIWWNGLMWQAVVKGV